MPAEVDYITLEQLQYTLGQTSVISGAPLQSGFYTNDAVASIAAASREIDGFCNRQFGLGEPGEVRYYQPTAHGELEIDDLATTSGLIVQSDDNGDGSFVSTWVLGTDFEVECRSGLGGYNAALDGWPFDTIVVRRNGNYRFTPAFTKSAKVTGQFGWNAVPAPIIDAVSLLAARQYMLKRNAPLDVLPGSEAQGLMRLGSKIQNVLTACQRYQRHRVAVA